MPPSFRRLALGSLLPALVLGMLASGLAAPAAATPERPQAGLVLQLGDGRVRSICVDLGGPEISGLELLERSGLDLAYQATILGTMVCRIDQSGCAYPAEDCWCACQSLSAACRYWAYHRLEEGLWRYAITGPASSKVHHGDVDGWAWGPGSIVAGSQPPVMTFAAICRPAPAAAPSGVPPTPASARTSAAPAASAASPGRPRSTSDHGRPSATPALRSSPTQWPLAATRPRGTNPTATPDAATLGSANAGSEAMVGPGSALGSTDRESESRSTEPSARRPTVETSAVTLSSQDQESSASRSTRKPKREPQVPDAGRSISETDSRGSDGSAHAVGESRIGYLLLLAMTLLFGGMAWIGRRSPPA